MERITIKVAYIDCFTGLDNESLLGAWFDLGLPQEEWQKYMARIGWEKDNILIERRKVKETAATFVHLQPIKHPSLQYISDIENTIDSWDLPQKVKDKSKQVFQNWLTAEAAVRDMSPENISFSQITPVINLGSIVGNILAWYLLEEPECYVSIIGIGNSLNHNNLIPITDPVVVQLLLGYPTISHAMDKGMNSTTAALIRTLAVPAPQVAFIGEKVGYGVISEQTESTNILRVQLGEWYPSSPTIQPSSPKQGTVMIEANIDDMSPELAGNLIPLLLSKGAMDAYIVPIIMKKGRPGLQLRVACKIERQMDLQKEIVRQTTTIGMRHYSVKGWAVPHEIIHIQTSYGEIPVKVAYLDGEIVNVAPEFEICRQTAENLGLSIKSVYQTVLSEALKQYPYRQTNN